MSPSLALASVLALPLGLAPNDPAPGLFRTKAWSRNLDCERVSASEGNQRYPGVIDVSGPRGDYVQRSAVICRERVIRAGLRSPLDEAMLTRMDAEAGRVAQAVGDNLDRAAGRTWLVETYFENPVVAEKISFATKNALVGEGLRVSDRTPVLGASDLARLTRMAPRAAYPAACTLFAANGSLGPDDALLAVVHLDPRETQLHAGVCAAGAWRWLQ